jgi:hypothetical protein
MILAFVWSGVGIHRARQYAGAVLTERTTTTHEVYMHMDYHVFYFRISKYYTCSYDFEIDGASYSGDEDCSQLRAEDSIKTELSDTVRELPGSMAIVYYDPADPSTNSLTEFSAKSGDEYRAVRLPIGFGVIILLFIAVEMVLSVNNNKRSRGVCLNAKGTVIYSEQIHFGTEFGRLPGGSERATESDVAVNNKAARDAYFAASQGLRRLYLDVVKQIHPDHALTEVDRGLRERLTKEANEAFKRGDDESLRQILEEYRKSAGRLSG